MPYDKSNESQNFWKLISGSPVPIFFVARVLKSASDPALPAGSLCIENTHTLIGQFYKEGRGLIANVSPIIGGAGSALQFRWDTDNKLDTTLLVSNPSDPRRNLQFKDFDDHHKELDPKAKFNFVNLDFAGNKIALGIGSGINENETVNEFYKRIGSQASGIYSQ